jgi:hypothetical protein
VAWIESFSARDPNFGFNTMPGGGFTAASQRKAVRQKMSASAKAKWKRPGMVEKLRETMNSPATKALMSANGKAQWRDPEVAVRNRAAVNVARARPEVQARMRAAIAATKATPEFHAKASTIRKEVWERPGFREATGAAIAATRTPEWRAKASATQKVASNRPEVRARHAAAVASLWEDPAYRASQSAAIRAAKAGGVPDEVKARLSEASKAKWLDPDYIAKQERAAAERSARPPKPCKKCGRPRNAKGRCRPCLTAHELARRIRLGVPGAGTGKGSGQKAQRP